MAVLLAISAGVFERTKQKRVWLNLPDPRS